MLKSRAFNASQSFKSGKMQEEAIEKEDPQNSSKRFVMALFFLALYNGDIFEEGRLKKVLQQEREQALVILSNH